MYDGSVCDRLGNTSESRTEHEVNLGPPAIILGVPKTFLRASGSTDDNSASIKIYSCAVREKIVYL
jgi:hypothetical protein